MRDMFPLDIQCLEAAAELVQSVKRYKKEYTRMCGSQAVIWLHHKIQDEMIICAGPEYIEQLKDYIDQL